MFSQKNAENPNFETFQLFSSSVGSGFGIFDDVSQNVNAIPPPPCVEVLVSESEVNSCLIFFFFLLLMIVWIEIMLFLKHGWFFFVGLLKLGSFIC